MPNNEGFTMPHEGAFSILLTVHENCTNPESEFSELYVCNTCAAVVTYWGRENHYDWHQTMKDRL